MHHQVDKLLNNVAKRERKRAQMTERMIEVHNSRGETHEENLYDLTHRRVIYGGLTRLRRKLFGDTIADIPHYKVTYK